MVYTGWMHACTRTHAHTHAHTHTHTHTHTYIYIYICRNIPMCVYIYICVQRVWPYFSVHGDSMWTDGFGSSVDKSVYGLCKHAYGDTPPPPLFVVYPLWLKVFVSSCFCGWVCVSGQCHKSLKC